MELSCYSFDVSYHPGKENAAFDTLSRMCGLTTSSSDLQSIHRELCHPGITRMTQVVRSRNLPYSVEDVKRITNSCQTCAENKPRFYKPPQATLVKATQLLERLNQDFKGSLPSKTENKYMLTIIDKYSRFPFIIPCPDVMATTVIQGLCSLFAILGVPASIYTDRGAAFTSEDLKSFLHERRVVVSRTSTNNPHGNELCE